MIFTLILIQIFLLWHKRKKNRKKNKKKVFSQSDSKARCQLQVSHLQLPRVCACYNEMCWTNRREQRLTSSKASMIVSRHDSTEQSTLLICYQNVIQADKNRLIRYFKLEILRLIISNDFLFSFYAQTDTYIFLSNYFSSIKICFFS